MPTHSQIQRDPTLAERLATVFGRSTDPMAEVEARAHALLLEYDAIVWEGDAATFHFDYVGRAAERVLGYPAERWTTESTFWSSVVVHPQDRDDAVAYPALCTGKGEDHDFEYRAVTADGRMLRLHDVVRVVKGDKSIATRLRGIMLDVTSPGHRTGPKAGTDASTPAVTANVPATCPRHEDACGALPLAVPRMPRCLTTIRLLY